MNTTLLRLVTITLLAIVPSAVFAQSADNASLRRHRHYDTYTHPIIGVWDSSVTITDCTSGAVVAAVHALNAFLPGGMLMDANTMPAGMRGPSFGRWAPTWNDRPANAAAHATGGSGRNDPPLVTGRMRFYRYGPDGLVAGTNVIDRQVQVSDDGLSFTGIADGHILDLEGNELKHTCTTEVATRVE